MPFEQAIAEASIECLTSSGRLLAHLRIIDPLFRANIDPQLAPLIKITDEEAQQYGEKTIQLIENARYEYDLQPSDGASELGLRLESNPVIKPFKSIRSSNQQEHGILETGTHVGLLPFRVIADADPQGGIRAEGYVEVRSVKIGSRRVISGNDAQHRRTFG